MEFSQLRPVICWPDVSTVWAANTKAMIDLSQIKPTLEPWTDAEEERRHELIDKWLMREISEEEKLELLAFHPELLEEMWSHAV